MKIHARKTYAVLLPVICNNSYHLVKRFKKFIGIREKGYTFCTSIRYPEMSSNANAYYRRMLSSTIDSIQNPLRRLMALSKGKVKLATAIIIHLCNLSTLCNHYPDYGHIKGYRSCITQVHFKLYYKVVHYRT